jgi:hypothetical protein
MKNFCPIRFLPKQNPWTFGGAAGPDYRLLTLNVSAGFSIQPTSFDPEQAGPQQQSAPAVCGIKRVEFVICCPLTCERERRLLRVGGRARQQDSHQNRRDPVHPVHPFYRPMLPQNVRLTGDFGVMTERAENCLTQRCFGAVVPHSSPDE